MTVATQKEVHDDGVSWVLSAGSVVEFLANGLVYVRRRTETSLIIQRFQYVGSKWECLTTQDLDDAPPVEMTISIAGPGKGSGSEPSIGDVTRVGVDWRCMYRGQ